MHKEILNMNINETIKYETEKRINQFKEGAKAKGLNLTAMGLANFDGAELFKETNK